LTYDPAMEAEEATAEDCRSDCAEPAARPDAEAEGRFFSILPAYAASCLCC
jgi:hypothetical protein